MKNSTIALLGFLGIGALTLTATTVASCYDKKTLRKELEQEHLIAHAEIKAEKKVSAETQKRIEILQAKLGEKSAKQIRKK